MKNARQRSTSAWILILSIVICGLTVNGTNLPMPSAAVSQEGEVGPERDKPKKLAPSNKAKSAAEQKAPKEVKPAKGERTAGKETKELSSAQKALIGYVLIAGVFGLVIVRPPLMQWYNSQSFFVSGRGPVDILLKQFGYRIGFELFIYAVACLVGSLGGWIYVLIRAMARGSSSAGGPGLRT